MILFHFLFLSSNPSSPSLHRRYVDREKFPLGSGFEYRLLIRSRSLIEPNPTQFGLVWVTIVIDDVNDSPPSFFGGSLGQGRAYQASVMEHANAGTSVITVTAFDPDENPTTTYMITKITPSTYNGIVPFTINTTTGEITTTISIDREQISQIFALEVSAMDEDDISGDSTTVLVDIIDLNDNSPVFSTTMARQATIPETSGMLDVSGLAPGSVVIANIFATDADLADNGLVSYVVQCLPISCLSISQSVTAGFALPSTRLTSPCIPTVTLRDCMCLPC